MPLAELPLFEKNRTITGPLEFHLGVKSEGKVFTRNVEMEKEITVLRSTPERVEEIMNEILTDVFDTFFSSPY